jgi:hypothetical protein
VLLELYPLAAYHYLLVYSQALLVKQLFDHLINLFVVAHGLIAHYWKVIFALVLLLNTLARLIPVKT